MPDSILKITDLRVNYGGIEAVKGKIEFRGADITGKDPTSIMQGGITLVPEGRMIFPNLTVQENLRVGAYIRKDDISADLDWVYGLFPRLKERT